jgi:TolB-like protein
MGGFVQRLKERKLVQWALAYVAAGFALLQAIDIVAQRFGWPETLERALILALAVGFLVTLVLAWYHGERGTQRVTGTELLILALLLAIGGGALWKFAGTPAEGQHAGAAATQASATPKSVADNVAIPHKSIAVLPFTDLSPGHDQEYFSDGMSEEILDALAKVKDLKVAGRTSSFSFKGKNDDLRLIGKALSVAHVLEGSVRKQGDKVRITAQLIQAEDGYHLWSETYDGDLSDVFALQERIARKVTDQLKLILESDQQQRLVSTGTSNVQAYSLYLQATGIFNRREGSRFPEAVAALEQALVLDPQYARAHSRLAAIHVLEPVYHPEAIATALAAVEREAQLATQLDPTLAEPYAALGVAYEQRDRYLDGRPAMDRALALNPEDVTANFWAGVNAINVGYTARGCALIDRALAIDPLLPNALLWRGIQYVYSGNADRAEKLLREAADVGLAHVGVGMQVLLDARGDTAGAKVQLLAGMRVLGAGFPPDSLPLLADGVYGDASARAKALAAIDEFIAKEPPVPGVVPYTLVLMHEDRRALALITKYGSSNGAWYYHRVWAPGGRSIRALPEFREFARRIGWTALWDKYGAPDVCRRIAPGDYDCAGEVAPKS